MDTLTDQYLVAVVQHAPVYFDRDASVEKAVSLIGEASGNGAKLVVFPEAWLPGYPAYIFGAAEWDDPVSKAAFARMHRNAVEVPSPATDALCQAARAHGVHVVMGCTERDTTFSRGTLFNSLIFIGGGGALLGVHRKLLPTHAERILWGQGDGSTLHVFETPLGRVGGLICWEHWMPLARFAMHAQAEQVQVAAWPEVPDIHRLASRHYAFEGRCFVICAGSFLARTHIPADFEAARAMSGAGDFGQADGVILPGGSGLIGPDGQWISGPAGAEETLVYGEIDLRRIAAEQQALDAAGHYNRPDVFQLSVDTRARDQISWIGPTVHEELPTSVVGEP
ncbi:MAG: carbon-nitrogen hydrolase family protein [Actinomycetota bacterium]